MLPNVSPLRRIMIDERRACGCNRILAVAQLLHFTVAVKLL
jgi:hypothetical protein